MEERLQKLLSQWGVASRRRAEEMISAGRVRVNGETVCLGYKANPKSDRIEIDGVPLGFGHRPQPIYLLLHKPAGVVSTCFDPQKRRTAIDLLPVQFRQGIHPVGRLDMDSTGALLLTNDGALTFHLTHPRHQISKTYRVLLCGNPPESVLETWRQGILLDGRPTQPARVRVLERTPEKQTSIEVILTEGRNRQIRRVAALLGYPVLQLHRSAIGSLQLQPPGQPGLLEGEYRSLKPSELGVLQAQLGIQSSVEVVSELEEYRR
ncbi:MAG: pseudouridine synthase [Geitlerinemataceae cyanobacterium]